MTVAEVFLVINRFIQKVMTTRMYHNSGRCSRKKSISQAPSSQYLTTILVSARQLNINITINPLNDKVMCARD